jgi:hypothetical protein
VRPGQKLALGYPMPQTEAEQRALFGAPEKDTVQVAPADSPAGPNPVLAAGLSR